jgi:putative transposase
MSLIQQHRRQLGALSLCRALEVPRASFYRQQVKNTSTALVVTRKHPEHALSDSERQTVLTTLHEPRFVDLAPTQVYAQLLEEGRYLCSIRTMYRLLAANDEVRERRAVASHVVYAKPELLATRPNEVGSWDITKLKGPAKWTYYYLYVILDIFSRYVVGWMIAERESSTLAQRLIAESCRKQNIGADQLTLHADRGSSMKSKVVAQLLADLGVTKTHSRPHVSNDNPFSESQFKTMKYRPEFPRRFGCIQDARAFGCEFFPWYNGEHRHSGLALYTPSDVHHGRIEQVRQSRQAALDAAYQRHPNRFVRKPPEAALPPQAVWINPPKHTQNQLMN